MNNNEITNPNKFILKNKIYFIRGYQVMLDRDLAELYEVETKYLNRVVKRNIDRFPIEFSFQITKNELESLRCQFVTSKKESAINSHILSLIKGGRRYLPYVFTEQGVAMLSAVLRSNIAVKTSIVIIKAFIEMRKFVNSNAQIFQRLDRVEIKQIETDTKIDKIFTALESKEITPKQGIFFDGQIFDAYKFVSDLFRSAKKSIMIIDNYIDDTVLIHLTKVTEGVKVRILTKSITDEFKLDLNKFEKQYFLIELKIFKQSHDRFILIDEKVVYHFGASLKDLGKKWFAFSKMDKGALNLLNKIEEIK
ncbi:MAG: ORF6N domain-containing protein [Candidatus Delongbacteria bacterium]|nr:ORF6N domain-containing protein [Candidatus Delongbacteria bacterium]